MPYVHIHWFEGRTPEQKAELARRITEAMGEVASVPADQVWVRFDDSSPADWAMGGDVQARK
jgi:4-oxalocrotonate tautomerase